MRSAFSGLRRNSGIEQLLQGVGDGNVVAAAMQPLQQRQRVGDRTKVADLGVRVATERRRDAERMEPAEALLPFEQLLVANREQRPAQRRKH